MSEVSIQARLRGSANDRLGVTLFLAAVLHAIVILGIGFDLYDPSRPDLPRTLEVTLVHSRSDEAPDKPEYLAQANQRGGGNVKEKIRPASPFPNALPTPRDGNGPETRAASTPPQRPVTPPEVLTRKKPAPVKAQVRPQDRETPEPEEVTGAELIHRSYEIARLSAEIRERQQAYAQMPRHKYVTANTREHVSAMYEEAWRMKVERIGNLNYPDEAKRTNLSGTLILDVAINADGTLHDVRVLRSSQRQVLDDGAVRIVELAAPFAPLPEAIRRDTDVLHIIRAWQFRSDNSLSTQSR